MKEKRRYLIFSLLVVFSFAVLALMYFSYRNFRGLPPGSAVQVGTDPVAGQETPPSSADEVTTAPTPAETESFAQAEETTPAEEQTAPPEVPGGGTALIRFVGDIYISNYVESNYDREGITGVLDGRLQDAMETADLMIANQEFPFSTRGQKAPDKQYTFRVDPKYVSMLQEMYVDVVTLANNHTLDYGTDALLDTFETLDQAGIAYVGAGAALDRAKQPYITEINGIKIGLIGASRVIPVVEWGAGANKPGMLSSYEPSVSVVLEEIQKAKEVCDYVIVYVHWGIERDDRPQEYQRKLGQRYIDAGADLVIGSHPHVLQGIEYYNGKPIVYSLGNYLFGSSIPKTMLLSAVVAQDGSVSLSLLPASSVNGYTTAMPQEEVSAFYSYYESISEGIKIDPETGQVTGPQE